MKYASYHHARGKLLTGHTEGAVRSMHAPRPACPLVAKCRRVPKWQALPSTRWSHREQCGQKPHSGRGLQVMCMANQRRVARVAKQIERELGTLLQGDQVLQNAICPEKRIGYDSSLSALASVTEVQLSSDLQVAKVYLSIYSDKEGKATALKGLSKLQGYARTRLASQMQLRMVPEIRFINDDAAEEGEEVLALLARIKRQDAGEEEMPPLTLPSLPDDAQGPALASIDGMQDIGTEDGFLDLDDEGFLVADMLDEEVFAAGEEGEEEEEEEEEEDNTAEVVEAYLAGIGRSGGNDFEGAEAAWSSPSGNGRQGRIRSKRKYRSKSR